MDEEKQSVQEEAQEESQKESAPPKEEKPSVEEKPAVPQKTKGRILLIEDDLPMVKMYSTKLEKEGFEVEVVYDGEEGLGRVKESPPDLVLLDLMIPKMGGMDLLEKLRLEPKTKKLPVVILSNLSQEQDIQRSRQLGVEKFLIKSNYTPSQVVEIIKGCLKR